MAAVVETNLPPFFFFSFFELGHHPTLFPFFCYFSRRSENARSYTERLSHGGIVVATRGKLSGWGGEQQGRGEGRAGHGMVWHGIVLCAKCLARARGFLSLADWFFLCFFLLLLWAFMEIPYTTPLFTFYFT